MPEPEKSDRWNSLLEALGVPASEPPAPAAETAPPGAEEAPPPPARPQPISMLPPGRPKPPAKPKPAPPAAKSPSYWSRIAGALGLETAPEPPTAPPPEVEAPLPAVSHVAQRDVEEAIAPPTEHREAGREDEVGRLPPTQTPREFHPRGEMEEEEREGRRRRRRRRGRRGPREEKVPISRGEEEIEPAGEEVDLEYEREEDLEAALPEETAERGERLRADEREPRMPRQEREARRRRRREGYLRRDEREEHEPELPATYQPDEEERELWQERPEAEPRGPRFSEEAEEHELDMEHEDEREEAGGLPGHRKIPTWEEAVGILIDANLAARAASPDRTRPRNRNRGR